MGWLVGANSPQPLWVNNVGCLWSACARNGSGAWRAGAGAASLSGSSRNLRDQEGQGQDGDSSRASGGGRVSREGGVGGAGKAPPKDAPSTTSAASTSFRGEGPEWCAYPLLLQDRQPLTLYVNWVVAGVYKHGDRYQARLILNGKVISIGRFADVRKAAKAYDRWVPFPTSLRVESCTGLDLTKPVPVRPLPGRPNGAWQGPSSTTSPTASSTPTG